MELSRYNGVAGGQATINSPSLAVDIGGIITCKESNNTGDLMICDVRTSARYISYLQQNTYFTSNAITCKRV
jgi:hypothetical protein